jgi:hypothetical protein
MPGYAMKSLVASGLVVTILIGLGGCSAQSGDTWPAPEKRQISSTVQRSPEETLVVAVTSSGGGAGDITHRVLACNSGSDRCELLASIDTNDRPAPALSKANDGVALIVNKGDYVAGFRNFSRELGSLQPGELYLQYRVDSKGTEVQ